MNNKPLNNTTPTFNNKVVVSGNKVVSTYHLIKMENK